MINRYFWFINKEFLDCTFDIAVILNDFACEICFRYLSIMCGESMMRVDRILTSVCKKLCIDGFALTC